MHKSEVNQTEMPSSGLFQEVVHWFGPFHISFGYFELNFEWIKFFQNLRIILQNETKFYSS